LDCTGFFDWLVLVDLAAGQLGLAALSVATASAEAQCMDCYRSVAARLPVDDVCHVSIAPHGGRHYLTYSAGFLATKECWTKPQVFIQRIDFRFWADCGRSEWLSVRCYCLQDKHEVLLGGLSRCNSA
jgi:hypothetical protein